MDSIWLEMVLIVVAILANGFFSGSEIALVSARVTRLNQLREEGMPGAATAIKLKQAPETFLATVQIAITLVGTLASAVGGAAAVEALTPWLGSLPVAAVAAWARPIALAFVVLVITYVSLVVGELAPKAIALRNPERIAALAARPIQWIARCTSWLVHILTVSTRVLVRLVGLGTIQESPFVSEEEVRYLVREGAAKGIFEKVEEELVHNVFEFADTTVRQVMVPRPNILGIDATTRPEDVLEQAVKLGHSRIPVYNESIDKPVGVIVLKDLLRCAARGEPPVLSRILHPPLFVPETARISVLLREFQRSGLNLAMVVDEYGGVIGLVTLEDVLEEIVGDIREERESTALPYVSRLPDGSYVFDGTALVWDIREKVGVPLEDSSDYQTIAGFLIHTLQAIPTPGASISFGGYRFTVVATDGPRILKVKAQRESR